MRVPALLGRQFVGAGGVAYMTSRWRVPNHHGFLRQSPNSSENHVNSVPSLAEGPRHMGKPFDILVAEYQPMILSYLRAVLADEHLAEDLTQETFLAAHRKIESFDTNRNFGAWLRGIARNNVLQDRRAMARHPMVIDSDIVEGMEQVYHLFDDAEGPWQNRTRRVRRCVARLNDNLRAVVVEIYGRAQTIRQTATRMGISLEAVAKRLSRARELIRECVEQSIPNTEDKPDKEPEHARTR